MSAQPYSGEDIEEIRDAGNRNVAPLHTECWLATLDAPDALLREAADAWVQLYSRVGLDPAEQTGSVELMRQVFVRIEATLGMKP